MSAPMIGVMVLVSLSLMVAVITSFVIFANRSHIKGGLWRRYHATVKVVGMGLFVVMVILAQSSGQIG